MAAQRNFSLSLDRDLVELVEQYRVNEGMETGAAAVRQILRQHFAATPEDAAVLQARRRAYEEIKKWSLTELSKALEDIRRRVELDLG